MKNRTALIVMALLAASPAVEAISDATPAYVHPPVDASGPSQSATPDSLPSGQKGPPDVPLNGSDQTPAAVLPPPVRAMSAGKPAATSAADGAVDASLAAPTAHHWFASDPDSYSIISAGHGLSLHKPMYLLPATYAEDYHGKHTEVLFALSLKQRLFGIPLYFAYSQKSFFDAYDTQDSKPFRGSDYNPELFYRWIPENQTSWHHLGFDFGAEHESNGQSLPDSRSWNRLYIAPFQAAGTHLLYWKWWWRLPENESAPQTSPNRDDNPDIEDYYGYSELHVEQQLFGDHHHLAHAMFRFNPATGRGAFELQYSIPSHDDSFFWGFYLWQGYGESLIDYNHCITRVGIGVMLTR